MVQFIPIAQNAAITLMLLLMTKVWRDSLHEYLAFEISTLEISYKLLNIILGFVSVEGQRPIMLKPKLKLTQMLSGHQSNAQRKSQQTLLARLSLQKIQALGNRYDSFTNSFVHTEIILGFQRHRKHLKLGGMTLLGTRALLCLL